ncbi:E3 ubiquitin-protein ligase APD2-like [Hibiscus syriacus]|nr:E3 ubiquitin-protein ligase APD2-like [Hibiscus syriacus]
MMLLLLKAQESCHSDFDRRMMTNPILPKKPIPTNETSAEEDNDDESSSSRDLKDAKLCIICYEVQRNCFFVPCGHCATCYECAKRVMEEDNKMCPICRKKIRKARKMFTPKERTECCASVFEPSGIGDRMEMHGGFCRNVI